MTSTQLDGQHGLTQGIHGRHRSFQSQSMSSLVNWVSANTTFLIHFVESCIHFVTTKLWEGIWPVILLHTQAEV